MTHLLTLSRVARLTGVPRATLQRMAQAGTLATFDGAVAIDEVLRHFPDLRLEDDSEIRRVEAIKAAALTKPRDLPDPAALSARLAALAADLARLRVDADRHAEVAAWLPGRLADMVDSGAIDQAAADALIAWQRRQLAIEPAERARRERLIALEARIRIMSATVTLLPGGQTFDVDGRETLLEAGLRAGLSLAYGCSNGNCGDCRARLVEGEVVKVKPHDYMPTRQDKADNMVLTCAYSPVGDVTLEVGEPAEIPEQTLVARVRQVETLGPGRRALNLMTSRAERLRFRAGQRLTVAIGAVTRDIHVASCPCEERRIELHVTGDDEFAAAVAALKPNAPVTLTGPYGQFVLDEADTRPLLLIALGPGFGPVKGLIQHALALEQSPGITLMRQADAAGPYQQNLTRAYADSLEHFFCRPVTDGDWAQAFADLSELSGPLAAHRVYAAGPEAELAAVRQRALSAGLPETQWTQEAVA